jgi:proteasome accessory factor A
MTALEIQRTYLEVLAAAVEQAGDRDGQTADVLARWASVLDRLGTDPMACSREVEWVAKLRVLEAMRARDHLAWDHARLAAIDLQWSDVRPERGLYSRLAAAGAVERLVPQAAVDDAVHTPPTDTRAYFRGESVRRYGAEVAAANWDCVIFDIASEPMLRRVPMSEPYRGTREHVGALLERSPDAARLMAGLVDRA